MTLYTFFILSLLVALCRCEHNFTYTNNGQDSVTGLAPLYEPAEDWKPKILTPSDSDVNAGNIQSPVNVMALQNSSDSAQLTVFWPSEGKRLDIHFVLAIDKLS